MGKGSQAPAGGEQRMISLPEYADPYFRRLLQGAEEATMPYYPDDPEKYGDLAGESTYVPYEGERLARTGEYSDITDSRQRVRDIADAGIPGMSEAVAAQREGISGLRDLAGSPTSFTPSQFTETSVDPYSDFSESQFTRGAGTRFDFADPRQFTGGEVQDYMDPYMQSVVDIQKREAVRDFERGQAGRDAAAVGAGAYGGSRQAIQQGMAQENLQQRLGDIQQIGSQAAFDRAMKMFESDRAAQMDTEQRRAGEQARLDRIGIGELGRTEAGAAAEAARRQAAEAAELARTQGVDVSEAARVQGADAAEQARIQAAQEAQRMNTADLYRQYMGAGAGLAGLGERARGTDIQNAQLLEALGQGIRAEDQALLDMDYQDFLRQQDYPVRQYERFAGILSGVPVQPDVYTQTYQSYNPTQQLLGAGLAGLGMYRGLGYGG